MGKKSIILEDIEDTADNEDAESITEGGRMIEYDNLISFLDNKAKKVFTSKRKYKTTVKKGNQMYGKEGEYCDVYHFKKCTIAVVREFEMNQGRMKVNVYGENAGKILNNLDKLTDIEV